VTLKVHEAPAARVLGVKGQLFVCANGPLLILIAVSVMAAADMLVSVTLCEGLVVPTATLLKVSEVGEYSTVPTEPLPDNGSDCVALGASSVSLRALVRGPVAKGRDCTDIVQELPAARVDGLNGQVVEEMRKSAPAGIAILDMVSGTAWVLVTVTDFAEESWPTWTAPHDSVVGDKVTSWAKAAEPANREKAAHSPMRYIWAFRIKDLKMSPVLPWNQVKSRRSKK